MGKDLYAVLGVQKGADAAEIKRAYKKLVVTEHPDKGGNEERFKEIQGAYEVLSDDQKRGFYDATGQVPGEDGGGGGGGGGFPFGMGMGGMGMGGPFPFDIRDLFGGLGGGMRGRQAKRQGGKAPARSTQLPLSLNDYYHGKSFQIRLDRQKFCTGCKGEGSKSTQSCAPCHGTGTAKQIIQMGPMMMESHGPCPTCQGEGKQKGPPCNECSGSGFMKEHKDLEIHILGGMSPGETIVFPGVSSDVQGYKEAGDVVIELQAADEDLIWSRDGKLLKTSVVITLTESLLGSIVRIDGHPGFPDGCFVEIPQGTQNAHELRIPGLGMPLEKGGKTYGDGLITVRVQPTKEEYESLKVQQLFLETIFPKQPGPDVGTAKVHKSLD